eukprot:4532411-Pyramimonas_sp.AAC.1
MRALPLGPSVEPPCGATTRVRGTAMCGMDPHVGAATGAFGAAPYGATKRVRVRRNAGWNRMRALPLGPS